MLLPKEEHVIAIFITSPPPTGGWGGGISTTKTLYTLGFFISDGRRHDNTHIRWRHRKFFRHVTVSRYQQFPCNLNTQNYARQYHFQTSPPFEFIAKLCTGQASFLIKSVLHINKMSKTVLIQTPQWGAADADIKVPSGENTELKRSPFQAWSRSVYSHTCYAYCQGVLPCLFLPFQSIHQHFFQNLSQFFPVLACRIK